jgi:prolyl-tRNA synthetase
MREFIASYRDLPAYVYQFQTKLRNELRAKSGIMRSREFIMKDLYSYSRDQGTHQEFYEAMIQAYLRIFHKTGLGKDTYLTFASGGAFTQFSHEFQTVTEAGEDTIYLDKEAGIAINEEVLSDDVIDQAGVNKDRLQKVKAAEVGNIFSFGTKKSEELGLYFTDEDGSSKAAFLGSYGIGVSRLVGVITEHFADGKGLVWPQSVAPYDVYLAGLGDDVQVNRQTDEAYEHLQAAGLQVLYDDRDERPGEKFADADLLGIPYRVVISQKSLAAGGMELKKRTHDDTQITSLKLLTDSLTKPLQA